LATDGASLSSQYLLADDLLVRPVDPFDGLTLENKTLHTYSGNWNRNATVWLPPGEWHDAFTGEILDGNRNLSLTSLPLNRMPLFHRGGGMVFTSEGSVAGQWQGLALEVWPTRAAFDGSVANTRSSVSRHLYATAEADAMGNLQPWMVTKTETGFGFELSFSVGGFETVPWSLRVHVPSHAINLEAAQMRCDGQEMNTKIRDVSRDLDLVEPFTSKEVPSQAPGAVVEVHLDFQRIANLRTQISCEFTIAESALVI